MVSGKFQGPQKGGEINMIASNSLNKLYWTFLKKDTLEFSREKWWLSLNKQHESLGKRKSSSGTKNTGLPEWIKGWGWCQEMENKMLKRGFFSFPSLFPSLPSFLPPQQPSPFLPSLFFFFFWWNSILLERKKRKVIWGVCVEGNILPIKS